MPQRAFLQNFESFIQWEEQNMFSLRHRPIFDFQDELNQMRRQLNELLGTPGTGSSGTGRRVHPTGYPLLNAWEDEHNFYVEAEVPGLALEDLDISMTDRSTITIRGTRKEPTLEGGQWHRRERAFGEFERSLELPGAVDADNVEASFKNGVLTIKLPKAPELRPRKIEVKAS